MFDKHRKRRVIYNDDADQVLTGYEGYSYNITDEKSFIDTRTTLTFNTHVDTYVWCVGNGADPPWATAFPFKLLPCLESFGQATDLIVKACHAHGMEVWGSLRMNDIHDSFMADRLEKTFEPFKAEHPDCLIGSAESRSLPDGVTERYLWTALNFARPEVRQYRLEFIERNASAHDFDGYELDFTRFIWDFPLGEERECTHLMTDFVRRARKILNTIGQRRGRPYTFVVHVPDSLRTSLGLGYDVESWLAEGLVDVLVVGMGYVPYVLPLDQWLDLGRGYGVPVYPAVNTNTYAGEWMKLNDGPVFQEAERASSAFYWQQGADGLYLFNLFCQEDKSVGGLPREYIYAPLKEIGDPAVLIGKDKLYSIQPVADSGFCQHGSEATPLPVALDRMEHKLPLMMGPDAGAKDARIRVRAWVSGENGRRIWFRLNHKLLTPVRNGNWCEAEVPAGTLRPGENELGVWCEAASSESTSPIIVHRVFVPVTYGQIRE